MIKNLFFFKVLSPLGGTEQFLYEIAKKYHDKFDIVVAYQIGDAQQVKRLSKFVNVFQWQKGQKVECEKAFLNFNIDIIDDLICDDISFVCHANYVELGYKPPIHPRIKRTIAVSNFTKEIYEKHYDIPCETCCNPITMEKYEKPLILMSAFRANDPIKGMDRVKILIERLDYYCQKNDKRYLFILFSLKPCIEIKSPNFVVLPPRMDVRGYMKLADYGVTLSKDMETYCYTNVEFLMQGIPIITTPLTVADELKMDSSMRLICDWDMSNVDEVIEQIFNRKMSFNYTPPNDRWNELLAKGKAEYEREKYSMKIFKVKANGLSLERGIHITELGRIANPGEEFEITEDRIDALVNSKNGFNVPFAELIEEVKTEPKKETKEEEPVKEEKPVKKAKKKAK